MTPEEVLLESIQAASRYGDTPELRRQQAAKLEAALLAARPELLRPIPVEAYCDKKHGH